MAEKQFLEDKVNLLSTNFGLTLNSTSRAPIISNKEWSTYADMMQYVKSTASDASAYRGLILSVVNDEDSDKNGVYFVTGVGANGAVSKLGEGGAHKIKKLSLDTYDGSDKDAIDVIYDIVDKNEKHIKGSDYIKIYKDSSLTNIELTEKEIEGVTKQVVEYTYTLAGGTSKTITLDLSSLISETELSKAFESKTAAAIDNETNASKLATAGQVYNYVSNASGAIVGTDDDEDTALTLKGLSKKIGNINVDDDITKKINDLDVADTKVDHQYVSQVPQTDGKVAISRGNLDFDAILVNGCDDEDTDQAFKTRQAVGALAANTSIAKGTKLIDLLKKILVGEVVKAYVKSKPTASVSISPNTTTIEHGATASGTATVTVGNGVISSFYGINPEDANDRSIHTHEALGDKDVSTSRVDYNVTGGTATDATFKYTFSGGTTIADNKDGKYSQVLEHNQTLKIKATVSYASKSGMTYLNSDGTNETLGWTAGSADTNEITIKAKYAIWTGLIDKVSDVESITTDALFKSTFSSLTPKWLGDTKLNGNNTTVKIPKDGSKAFYVVCPSDKALYVSQLNKEARVDASATFNHIVGNKTTSYSIYVVDNVDNEFQNLNIK